ncbi:MAG: hypothetical protein FJ245_10015 [Nitrospira sp.]|nr:hypothetical protein [Nitrospira sp.]
MHGSLALGLAVAVMLMTGVSVGVAHHAGGVEVGDLETGGVVGQPFKELTVDADLIAIEAGGIKMWYPSVIILDLKVRPGRPVVLKVVNKSSVERGFLMTADGAFEAPTVLKAQVVLKPGETKYIGVPTSDLLYATQGSTLIYRDQLNPGSAGGKLLMIR